MNNAQPAPLSTDQSDKTGIVLNRMYTGSYLSSNLGHEVINMFPDDEGNHYMYLNATGDFSAEHVGKIGSMLLIKYAGQDEDGRPWVEVLGYATGLEDIYNPQNRKQSEKDTVPCMRGYKRESKQMKEITYGGKPIHDIFKGSAQQDVLISYYATKLYVPKEEVKIFLRFAPFGQKKKKPAVTFGYSDTLEKEPSHFSHSIEKPCISYIWKRTSSDTPPSPLYNSRLYVVEMETKFASTSLKRYYKYKDEEGTDADKIRKTNGDLDKIISLISKGELWRDLPEGSLTMNDSSQSRENTKKKDVSIFDICRIENNENCFSNALAHFMDKYRREWCTKFFKDKGITLNENFEIFREVDATISKNNNDKTKNSGESNKKGGRIDILLKDNKNIIIIENKIKSDINGVQGDVGDGKQLKRYQDYAHWLKFQPELDKIKDELQKLYVNSNCFDVHQDSGKVQIKIKQQEKKKPRRRTQEEVLGEEKWREFITQEEIEALDVHLFVLSPNYNIPHIPKSCKDWKIITYEDISIFLENEFTLSEDTNLEDFYNVMQRHTCENLCDWLRIDMREKFIARINKLK